MLTSLLVAACSEPPTKEYEQAKSAIEAAHAAKADTFAPAELQDAQAALKKYDDAVAQHDYRLALNDALEARDRAYDAVKEAGNKRSELRSQADRLATELDTLVASAATRLSAPTGRPVGQAMERLRTTRDHATEALQKARTRLAAQDYQGAIGLLQPAIAALHQEIQVPETAAPKKKK